MLVQQLQQKIRLILTLLILSIPGSDGLSQVFGDSTQSLKGYYKTPIANTFTKTVKNDSIYISDTVVVFNKLQIITLANKIQQIRDSLNFLKDLNYQQGVLINKLDMKISIYDSVMKASDNRHEAIKRQNEELNKIIINMQPSWYDNKLLWIFVGAGTTATIVYLIK